MCNHVFFRLDGSRFVHAYYVYPQATDESKSEVLRLKQSYQSDHELDSVGFEKIPNEFLWQKQTFILGINYFMFTWFVQNLTSDKVSCFLHLAFL